MNKFKKSLFAYAGAFFDAEMVYWEIVAQL